jgi:hypothetical protein
MKILDLFKKAVKGTSELDRALDVIISLESKKSACEHALEEARQGLQRAIAAEAGCGEADVSAPSVTAVVGASERLQAVMQLLTQARSEAAGLVAATSGTDRQRVAEVDEEMLLARAKVDSGLLKVYATFAKQHGLTMQLPNKHSGGAIPFPACWLETEEIQKIVDDISVQQVVPEGQAELDRLRAERARLNVLVGSSFDLGVQTLLEERRRSKRAA